MPDLTNSGLEAYDVVLRVKGDLGTRADNPMKVQGLQGPTGFQVVAGYAGLTEVARPRRVSYVHYAGAPPIHMQGDILLDTWSWEPDATVDGDFQMLELMAGLDPDHAQPYVLNIVGAGIPHQKFEWYIWDLTWGDDVIRSTTGKLRRITATIELVEAVRKGYSRKVPPVDNVTQPTVGHGTFVPVKGKKFAGWWIVKKDDTLQYIAKSVYGDARKWKFIARANGITNPKRLKPGQKLKIPRVREKGNPYGVVETAG